MSGQLDRPVTKLSSKCLHQRTLPPAAYEKSCSSTFSPVHGLCALRRLCQPNAPHRAFALYFAGRSRENSLLSLPGFTHLLFGEVAACVWSLLSCWADYSFLVIHRNLHTFLKAVVPFVLAHVHVHACVMRGVGGCGDLQAALRLYLTFTFLRLMNLRS